jgi:predicted nucleic acid-binding protein
MRNLLFDTGPFVALLDTRERIMNAVWNSSRVQRSAFTTEPVLTEVLYLLSPSIKSQRAGIEFILRGGAILVPQSTSSLKRGLELMEKYKDVPMDFADSTLVVLGEEMEITEIFTLDIKGFSTYRMHGKKAFRLWPA